jgi:hypothetical protein
MLRSFSIGSLLLLLGCGPEPAADPGDGTEVVTGEAKASDLLDLTTTCNQVSRKKWATDDGKKVGICGLNGAIFWTADMDIDCDGKRTAQCNEDTDCCFLPDTAFHNNDDDPLTASKTPYIVIPNDHKIPNVKGGAVAAVIFKNKLIFAILGDTGPSDIIGEASFAAAKALGINPDAKNGGTAGPVTYVLFLGSGAVPKDVENQTEVNQLGNRLTTKLRAANQ